MEHRAQGGSGERIAFGEAKEGRSFSLLSDLVRTLRRRGEAAVIGAAARKATAHVAKFRLPAF
jgi:hypothetical protein